MYSARHMSAEAVSSLTSRMRQVGLSRCLESQLELDQVNTSEQVDKLLRQGLDFDPNTIILFLLSEHQIALTPGTLHVLMARGAVCPPEIYAELHCCNDTVDEIVLFLMERGIYPVNPSADHLKAALEARCSFDTYRRLCQLGCQPNQQTFAYAGFCGTPSQVVFHLLSLRMFPNPDVLTEFLLNLGNWEEDENFVPAFQALVDALPVGEVATTEMLHIAIDNRLPNMVLQILMHRGARIDHCTYVKLVVAQNSTDWMMEYLSLDVHPFIALAVQEVVRFVESGQLEGIEARLADTLSDCEATTEMLNIALELNVSERLIQWMIETKGARPDRASRSMVLIRGESPPFREDSTFTGSMKHISFNERLETYLTRLASSEEVDVLLLRDLDFDPSTVILSLLNDYQIALTPGTLHVLMARGAVCPPEIYQALQCCVGTVDEIVPFLMERGIYPLCPSAVHLKLALNARCSFETYELLCQLGCQPNQQTLAYAGYCGAPSRVIFHLLSLGVFPNSDVLLDFLINLEDWEDDESFVPALRALIDALPGDQHATTEMLHIAIDYRLPDEILHILMLHGAQINHFTYVKMVVVQKNTEWMMERLGSDAHPFITFAISELGRLNEGAILAGAKTLHLQGVDEARLADTLSDCEATTEMLNIALQLNVSELLIQWMIEQRGARPDKTSKHLLSIRGTSPSLMQLILSYLESEEM